MKDKCVFSAAALGSCARDILLTETDANVCGNTSKGLFAVTYKKRVLYISHQTFKGPLTININGNLPAHQTRSHDTHLLLSPNRIKFIQSSLEIRINPQTHVWTPMILNKMDFNLEALINRSKLIEHEMVSQHSNNQSNFISCIHRNKTIQDQAKENQTNIINNLRSSLSSRNKVATLESLSSLIGFGEGLTPSGDDFICGFLLAAHAWKEILFPGFAVQKTIRKITELAWKKTTAISANLIACAACGTADERIIHCIEWLNRGDHSLGQIIKELPTYGSSSWLDTLTGMLTFILFSPVFLNKS